MQVREHFVQFGAHSGLSMCICAKTKGGLRSKGWVEAVTCALGLRSGSVELISS